MENEEAFVVYQSKFKRIGLVLLGFLMVLGSFILLFTGDSQLIIIGIGFFCLCEF